MHAWERGAGGAGLNVGVGSRRVLASRATGGVAVAEWWRRRSKRWGSRVG